VGLTSHARGRWFKPSRAHVEKPWNPRLFAYDEGV
jgi:hypothetical protein